MHRIFRRLSDRLKRKNNGFNRLNYRKERQKSIMSMLAKILQDMYVEPELLAELDEEQKQILFCKMREEQLRRHQQWTETSESKNIDPRVVTKPSKRRGTRVKFLKGADGQPWTWVMGEADGDRTIDEIIDNEQHEAAKNIAEQEAERLRLEKEVALKLTLARVHSRSNSVSQTNSGELSPTPTRHESNRDGEANIEIQGKHDEDIKRAARQAEELIARLQRLPDPIGTVVHTQHAFEPSTSDAQSCKVTTPIESPPTLFNIDMAHHHGEYDTTHENTNTQLPNKISENVQKEIESLENVIRSQTPAISFEELERQLMEQTAREIESEKQKRANEIYERLRAARINVDQQQNNDELQNEVEYQKQEQRARQAEEDMRLMARKAREMFRRQKEQWMQSTSKANGSLHSQSNRVTPTGNDSLQRRSKGTLSSNGTTRVGVVQPVKCVDELGITIRCDSPTVSSKRANKPRSKEAVVEWYRSEELSRGAGLDPKTGAVTPWFHGIITREHAEHLLRGFRQGAFLVRVSERIFGYTVSYCKGFDEAKHFLIERTPEGYQFMGQNQIVHRTLWDLISYHESVPITNTGREILLEPVGQRPAQPPDYMNLLRK